MSQEQKKDIEGSENKNNSRDRDFYTFNQSKLDALKSRKPWMGDAKYFKKVIVSAGAAIKMLTHSQSGVEKGIAQGGKPIEVMGLMLGRPCTENERTLLVTDVFPIPVEGFETRVVADDEKVTQYMIELSENLELTREENFMGWYHSHPFDVEVHSHCYLSSTDVSTQLHWQRAEDNAGNPYLAIVIDPLRSISKGRPEFCAFRVYPPEFTAPENETPDGTIITDDTSRIEKWGSCWNRYYQLEIQYHMNSLCAKMLGVLSEKVLWMHVLGSTPLLERENRDRESDRISNIAEKLDGVYMQLSHGGGGRMGGYLLPEQRSNEDSQFSKSTQSGCEMAVEQSMSQVTQIVKDVLFNQHQLADETKGQGGGSEGAKAAATDMEVDGDAKSE